MSMEILDKAKHDRRTFSCGVSDLDDYLKKRANQDLINNISVPYVYCEDGKTIAGFYTLSSISINIGDLPDEVVKKLPRYPYIPATLIGRLAVYSQHKKQGYGEFLLMDALYRSYRQSTTIAAAAIVVDVKSEDARSFYGKYGFRTFPDHPGRMFVMMVEVGRMFGLQ